MVPTLARRYFFKLFANIVSVPVYLVMEAILPRALGPQTYGNFSFSTNLFLQFSGFLDMGSSTCFYNYLSREPHNTALFSFYLKIILIIAAALFCSSLICIYTPAGRYLLPDMPTYLAPLGALWAFLTWIGRLLRSTNDALGATIPSEIWRALLSLAGVVLLAAIFFADCLNIYTLFAQQYLLLGLTAAAFWLVSRRHWLREGQKINLQITNAENKKFTRDFFNYSHPLFIQALLSFFMLTAERWLLQWFDGSTQQGFYALSQKVSMACFLFVSAMTPLLMRELSVAWGKKDLNAMGSLLSRFAPGLYVIAAYFSCFTMAEGETLVHIFGGAEFAAAVLPVQIMALYPLHQAYGQMATSVFHASGKTGVLRNLTACECLYGLATTWFLLAPHNLGGLNLGATGLALKTVCVQFVSVNICLWLASRHIPFAFWRNFAHQIWSLLLFIFFAFACRAISFHIEPLADYSLLRFIISGIGYTLIVCITIFLAPGVMGMTHTEKQDMIKRFGCRLPFVNKKGGQSRPNM